MRFEVQSILRVSTVAIVSGLLVSACAQKAENREGEDEAPPSTKDSAAGNLTTAAGATVDIAGANKVDCSGVKGESAPEGSPVDDVLGVRQGMQPDRVKVILACHDKNYIIREDEIEYSFGEEKIPGLKVTADTGLDKVIVQFMKTANGQEGYQLVKIGRYIEYAEGTGYAVDVLKGTLENKYGKFVDLSRRNTPRYGLSGNNFKSFSGGLAYAVGGQMLGLSNSAFDPCVERNESLAIDSNILINEKCATVVTYVLTPRADDDKQAQALTTVVTYPRLAFSGKLAATDAMKAAADARSAEVKSLAGAGKGPAL